MTAKNHGKEVIFDHATSISLRSPSDKSGMFRTVSNDESVIPQIVSDYVKEYVQKHKLAKSEAIFVVGRSDVEVRPMSFPQIPIEELPDIIRFQAAKEFNRYDPATPLDFFVLTDLADPAPTQHTAKTQTATEKIGKNGKSGKPENEPSGPRRKILASIVRKELLQEITKFCESANLSLKRVVLHPCEATYLLKQSPLFDDGKTYLLIEVDPTEALLTVVHKGQPVFMRSPRLFGERSERMKIASLANQLLAEIKRSLIAARNEVQGLLVDQLIVLGDSEEHKKLANNLQEALKLPVSQLNPWANIKQSSQLSKSKPEADELFAPLIGATLLAGRGLPSDIDYLNPKRKPPEAGKRTLFTAIGMAVCMLLFAGVAFGLWRNMSANEDVERLNARLKTLQKQSAEVDQKRKLLDSIEAWETSRFNWLSQMDLLSKSLPRAQDVIVTNLEMGIPTTGTGTGRIEIKGIARNHDIPISAAQSLRDAKHQAVLAPLAAAATGGAAASRNTLPGYTQPFVITLAVSQKDHGLTAAQEEPKPEEAKPEEPKPEETIPEEPKIEEVKPEPNPEETKPAEQPNPTDQPG